MKYNLKNLKKYINQCGYRFKITYCFKAFYMASVIEEIDKGTSKSESINIGLRNIKLLFKYILKLVSTDYKKRNEYVEILMKLFEKLPNDNVIYNQIREFLKPDNIDPNLLEKHNYEKITYKIINYLVDLLKNNHLSTHRRNILDIGTERLEVLEKYKEEFNATDVIGINIKEGFCHYDEKIIETEKKGIKFSYYDGVNIPKFDIKLDLVSITSVIHHIDIKTVSKLLGQIHNILSDDGIVFIKENDINDIKSRAGIIIQHMIFEGSVIDAPHNPLHPYTFDEIKKLFNNHNFKLVDKIDSGNFSHAYYAIFKKC